MYKDLKVFPHNLAVGSPLIAGELLFVVTGNGVNEDHVNIPFPEAPSFLAVNKMTGKVVWQDNAPTIKAKGVPKAADGNDQKSPLFQMIMRGEVVMHAQWSSPTYAVVNGKPQVIFPGGDGWLRSYEPATGKLIWKFDANLKHYKYQLGGRSERNDFIASAVVVDDKLYIGTGQDPEHYEGVAHLWCIDITRSGDVSAELVDDPKASPVKTKPNPNSAVVWQYGGATTKDDRDGLQRDYYFGRTMANVAVHGGLVYATELAGYVHCLNARTGKVYWVYDLRAATWGPPSWIDGKVYVHSEEGDVWIFRHGGNCDLIRKIEMGQAIRMTGGVIAANGVLYVMTESHLYAIAKK
jgi:outer membrane protein assembly factor BamB